VENEALEQYLGRFYFCLFLIDLAKLWYEMLKYTVRTRRIAGVKTTNGNSATCAIAVYAGK
jgi:hypothetical protein